MRYKVTIENNQERYRCPEGQHLLQAMESQGKRSIPIGCRGGGCGVCKVRVTSGSYTKKPMSRDAITLSEEAAGIVLACRCFPSSDLSLSILEKLEKRLGWHC